MSETELLNTARAEVAACSIENNTSASREGSRINDECFLSYGNDKATPIVVVAGDGRSRVRRVVRTATRHVTVISYSTFFKETRSHTSHHVNTVSFPQETIDRGNDTCAQYAFDNTQLTPSTGNQSILLSTCNGGVAGATDSVYFQDQCVPSSVSCNSSGRQTLYQQHHQRQQYHTCHQQQQQMLHATNGQGHYTAGAAPSLHYQQQQHHHRKENQQYNSNAHSHYHHHNHSGAIVIAGSGVGTGMGNMGMGMVVVGSNTAASVQPNKKTSKRNGNEVLKRTRAEAAYELSQDLLEKKIELLERKYGGLCARNSAVIIQRAFRHYMMVKKFASITAMAKAEKRLNRRLVDGVNMDSRQHMQHSTHSMQLYQQHHRQQQEQPPIQHQQQQQARVTIMAGPPTLAGTGMMLIKCPTTTTSSSPGNDNTSLSRTPPTRSMSMRERRPLDTSPIPRSQSGSSTSLSVLAAPSNINHPHVNLLHVAEPTHYYTAASAMGGSSAGHYYAGTSLQHDMSFNSSNSSANSSHQDSPSCNSHWVNDGTSINPSPHTPYYSAAQIYMRPKVLQQPTTTATSVAKRIPPEVPKRTSSIMQQQQQQQQQLLMRLTPICSNGGLCKTNENGSLTSVQSSGSDSSVMSVDRSSSPQTWKRSHHHHHQCSPRVLALSTASSHASSGSLSSSITLLGNGNTTTTDDHQIYSHTSAAQYEAQQNADGPELTLSGNNANTTANYKMSETLRKRQYRVGLNLFNKKPEKGITYLIRRGFLENTPQGVARFLISRKGLSRQMIGEYLGNLQNQFNMAVLNCFAMELDLSGMQVDVALRKYQTYFRMPGEAQKIERLMEVFSQRYCQCNQDIVGHLRSSDTIFVLAFAIIMLNTDLHTPNLKPERRMRLDDFIKNLRGIDDCHDIDREMLVGIYERVKAIEFKPGSDHVTQVLKVQGTIVGKKPNLALPHRRLVCYCRLYEIPDINKRERPGVHQREVFLFNDLLVITKIFSKKKNSVTYTFRNSYPLCGMVVSLLDVQHYPFCIQLSQKVDNKILVTFNARNEHDRCKFADDLKESISEMDEMEALRIEAELERQRSARNRATGGTADNRDSGMVNVELCPSPFPIACKFHAGDSAAATAGNTSTVARNALPAACANINDAANAVGVSQQLKRSALSNSLLDMHEQSGNEKPQRRGSVGSLDSGMSISFQSTTTSNASRENTAAVIATAAAKMRLTVPTVWTASNQQHQMQQQQQPQQSQQQYCDAANMYVTRVMLMPQKELQNQQQQQQQHPAGDTPTRLDENAHSTDV